MREKKIKGLHQKHIYKSRDKNIYIRAELITEFLCLTCIFFSKVGRKCTINRNKFADCGFFIFKGTKL